MRTATRNAVIAAFGSLAFLTGCGDGGAGILAGAVKHEPAITNVPPEWLAQLRSGKLHAKSTGLMAYSAWLYQHQDRLNEPYLLQKIATLYACEDGARAHDNEIDRPAIYASAHERLLSFYRTMPKTITVDGRVLLGEWQPDLGAFGWVESGTTARQPIAAPVVVISDTDLQVSCGSNQSSFPLFEDAIVLRLNNGMLSPIKIPPADASKVASRIGAGMDRYVTVEWSASLDDPAGGQPSGDRSGTNVYLDAKSAIVREPSGRELARF